MIYKSYAHLLFTNLFDRDYFKAAYAFLVATPDDLGIEESNHWNWSRAGTVDAVNALHIREVSARVTDLGDAFLWDSVDRLGRHIFGEFWEANFDSEIIEIIARTDNYYRLNSDFSEAQLQKSWAILSIISGGEGIASQTSASFSADVLKHAWLGSTPAAAASRCRGFCHNTDAQPVSTGRPIDLSLLSLPMPERTGRAAVPAASLTVPRAAPVVADPYEGLSPLDAARKCLLSEGDKGIRGRRAQFVPVIKDNRPDYYESACHASVQEIARDRGEDLTHIVSLVVDPEVYGDYRKEAALAFYDYAIHRSPYKKVFTNRTTDSVFKKGLVVKASTPSPLALAGCSLSRFSREWAYNMVLWHELVQEGIEETVALCLCYLARFEWDRKGVDTENLDRFKVGITSCSHDHWIINAYCISQEELFNLINDPYKVIEDYDNLNEADGDTRFKIASAFTGPDRDEGSDVSLANTLRLTATNPDLQRSAAHRPVFGGEERVSTYADVKRFLIDIGKDLTEALSVHQSESTTA